MLRIINDMYNLLRILEVKDGEPEMEFMWHLAC